MAAITLEDVEVVAYSSWAFDLVGLGSLATRVFLYLTVKADQDNDTDAQAILQLREEKGVGSVLLAVGGSLVAAADQTKGTLTVVSEATGHIRITVEEGMTGMATTSGLLDVKMLTATTATQIGKGSLVVHTPATRSI